MKLPNKYIAIDIETTGTEAHEADVIQIGAIVLNEDLTMGAEFVTYLKPTTSFRNPQAMEVNGITEEQLSAAPSVHEALDKFEEFCFQAGNRPLLAAWGTYFDVAFLRSFYKKIGREWVFSYRCLDLKSIAVWEAAKWGKSASGGVDTFLKTYGLEFEGTAHDALDDIRNTLRIIQAL